MRDLIRSFAATAVIQIANIISGILLARILLPVGRGELATVMLWPPVLATMGILGLAEATSYCVARKLISAGHILGSSLILICLFSLILVPLGYIIVQYVSVDFSIGANQAALLYLAFIPLNHVGLIVISIHQGELSIGRWNVLRASVHVAFTLLVVCLVLIGRSSLVSFAAASLLSNLITIILGLCMAKGQRWFKLGLHRDDIGLLLRFGLRVHLVNAVMSINERIDQLLISLLLNPTDLGIYVVASTYARSAGAIGDTLSILVFPKVANEIAPKNQVLIAGRYARAALALSIPTVIFGIALANWFIPAVFGGQFSSSEAIAQVMLISIIPLNLKSVSTSVLKAVNRGLEAGKAQSSIMILSIAFLGALIPTLGLMGAALAGLFTQVIAAGVMMKKVQNALGMSLRDLLWPHPSDLKLIFQASRFRN